MKIHLMPGEKELWSSFPGVKYRFFILFRDLMFGVLLGFSAYFFFEYFNLDFGAINAFVPVLVGMFGLFLGVYNQIILMLTRYTITNQRVIIKKGLINRRLTDIKNKNILDTKVEQKVNQLVLGCGTIFVFTANDSHEGESFKHKTPRIENIDAPFEVHSMLKNAAFGSGEDDNYRGKDEWNINQQRYNDHPVGRDSREIDRRFYEDGDSFGYMDEEEFNRLDHLNRKRRTK